MRTNAMRIENNVYYLPNERTRAGALSRFEEYGSYELLRTGFNLIGGAAIGFALANLPALSGAFLAALNVLARHGM